MMCHISIYIYIYIKGVCSLPENIESQRSFNTKLDKLTQLIQQSKHTVVLTGAGISTSAGIPDFRGPNGIWTREQQRNKDEKKQNKSKLYGGSKKRKSDQMTKGKAATSSDCKVNVALHEQSSNGDSKSKFISFKTALPTYTHRALVTHLILQPPPPPAADASEDESLDAKQRTYLHHIVTQNVDGLHRKTSLPRSNMSVLHTRRV